MTENGTDAGKPGRPVVALLVAIAALLPVSMSALAATMAVQAALMPYNSEGRYFDGTVVHHDGAQFVYATAALLALAVSVWMGWLAYRLARPSRRRRPAVGPDIGPPPP